MEIIIDNLKINYIIKGEGPVILLLHGWGVDSSLYINLINTLSKNNKVIALDMPGFGKSEQSNKIWNLDNYVDMVEKFINKLNLDDIILIGHSFGGRVIIKLYNKNRLNFNINKIILIASAGIKHELKMSKKIKVKIYKLSKKLLQKRFPKLLNKLKDKLGSQDYKNANEIMRGCLVQVINEDLSYLIGNIKVKTLLIWGTRDTATPIEDGRKMHELIKNSTLLEIEDGTHYAFLEKPLLVNKKIEDFISQD